MDIDMDVKFHIHGNLGYSKCAVNKDCEQDH